MLKKVILSHLGELTHDVRTAGDTIRYRIYYSIRAGRLNPEITIADRIAEQLSNVTVFNDGVYNSRTRTITWTVPARRLKRIAYVEFEATAQREGAIVGQAVATGVNFRSEKSNIVRSEVQRAPRAGWIPFLADAHEAAAPRTYLKDETTTAITVRFDTPGLFVNRQIVDGVAYQHVTLPGRAHMTEVGKPELPVVGEILEVPFGVDFGVEVVKAEKAHLRGYNVFPAQEPRTDASGTPASPRPPLTALSAALRRSIAPRGRVEPPRAFVLDASAYRADADYPSPPVTVSTEDIGVIRGHRVLLLKVNPVQYNPTARTLTVHKAIEVRVRFSQPAQVKGVAPRLRSRDFEQMLAAAVLNYKPQERFMTDASWEEAGEKQSPGCDYLIITHDGFYTETDPANAVTRLANWKRRKGYRTRVVKVGSLTGGNTAAAIRSYVQNAYDTWNPPPSHLLLIGDADLVRTDQGMRHPSESDPDHPQPRLGTDLGYVTVDGSDYFPDIFVGRLSADTSQQVLDMVDKIIQFEQSPPPTPANAGFYSNVSLAGLFTETDEDPAVITGQEDRPWIANMETIRGFLQNQGYTVERIYATDTGFPGNVNAQDPLRFHDGTNLPNNLRSPQYGWNGGTNQIRNAINAGRFLLTYRGHGWWGGLASPGFSNNNAAGLAQSDLTPLVIAITCQAGWFDNETDDDTHGGRPVADDCFAEVMLRTPRAGAIGVLAMTRISNTGPNDFLIFGAHKAIWPAFDPDPPWAGHPQVPSGQQVSLRKLGQIANFSKMYMARAYGADDRRRLHFQMHHLFGEPETTLWISAPGNLGVKYPERIGAIGLQEFVVNVTDQTNGQAVGNATVVLTRDDDIVQMRQTRTDGLAMFTLNDVGAGDLEVTVTALDFRPHLGTLAVTAGGAELNRLDPGDGPENQVIHVGGRCFNGGESVEILFGDESPVIAAANGSGEFGLGLPTVDLTVPTNYPHGLVNVRARGQASHREAVRVFQVRDQNPVDLWIYDQWNSSTWSLHSGDNPTWNSPDIQLYDSGNHAVDSNNLVLGDDYTVKVKVHNRTGFSAQDAKIVFKWENFGAGGPWQALPPVVSADIAADPPGVTEVQTTFQPHATGHLCIQVSIEHLEDTDTSNNTSQENLHVGYSSSPARACFVVWNPGKRPAPVHFEVRQLFAPKAEDRTVWATWVEHPDPQFLDPGGRAMACVFVDPEKAKVPLGAKAEFAVTCFVDGQMTGGVNLVIVKR